MKLKGFLINFNSNGKILEIKDNLSSEDYNEMWNVIQDYYERQHHEDIGGYLIIKEDDE